MQNRKTHDELSFSDFSTQISNEYAVLSIPSRLDSRQAGTPVELEDSR